MYPVVKDEQLPTPATDWYELHPEGLVILRPPTIEEYVGLGSVFDGMSFSLSFWWGDYILHGEARADWGEMYTQALDESGRAYHTLTKAVSTCRKIPLKVRDRRVPFSTHYVLSSLSSGSDDKSGHERVSQWLDFVGDHQIGGRETKVLRNAYSLPPVDLSFDTPQQEQALIKAGLIGGHLVLEPPPLTNEQLIERAKVILVKIRTRWPDAPTDNEYQEIINVLRLL